MSEPIYIACDLGAGSGRVMMGRIHDGILALDEIHRFVSPPVKLHGTLRWNIVQIFEELKAGLRKVADRGIEAAGISVDSWGVDYVLFSAGEPLLGLPYHYRDQRTETGYASALKTVGPELIFSETGIQFMPINTLYQLAAESARNPGLLAAADQFLNIADYLHFLFCGVAKAEETLASTTQLFNPKTHRWSAKLIGQFGLPERIFPEVVPPGTPLGPTLASLQEETGFPPTPVLATCSHDTGAAVVAVPATGDDWAFLSSGTWSLIGVELPEPLINDDVRQLNYTNEIGYGGTTRFLRNIVGMWLLQECQRTWQEGGQSLDFGELTRLAEQAEPFRSLINPNAVRFGQLGDMPAKIAAFCRESGQPVPNTPGQFVLCVLESLALVYQNALDELERLTGRTIRKLHIVGGGSLNTLLNQLTADATGRVVLAGPVEATAAGNVLVQAMTLGNVASLPQARQIVRDSFPIQELQPRRDRRWQQTRDRFKSLAALS